MTTVESKLERRAACLARGLSAMGVGQGQSVVVLCCAKHEEDRLVAVTAVEALGATPVESMDWGPSAIGGLSTDDRGRSVQLACEEGVVAWRAAKGRGIMIGEGEGVMWWKALECRYNRTISSAPGSGLSREGWRPRA